MTPVPCFSPTDLGPPIDGYMRVALTPTTVYK